MDNECIKILDEQLTELRRMLNETESRLRWLKHMIITGERLRAIVMESLEREE